MIVTMNLELADRFIPSYCSISIHVWDRGVVVNSFSTLLNPDSKIESFLSKRHGIYEKDIYNAPRLADVWHIVYDMLDGKVVLLDNANSFMKSFQKRCIIDGLNLPNFKYACIRSMFNRSYTKKKDFKVNLVNIKNAIGINIPDYNSYNDSLSIKNIYDYCLAVSNNFNIKGLYEDLDFVVGEVSNNYILSKDDLKTKYKEVDFFD